MGSKTGSRTFWRRFAERWRLLVVFLPFCIVLYTAKTLFSDTGTLREVLGQDRTVSATAESVVETETLPPSHCIAAPNDGQVRLRTGPGTGYAELVILHDGERVELVQDMDAWTRIVVRRNVMTFDGYVRTDYVKGCENES